MGKNGRKRDAQQLNGALQFAHLWMRMACGPIGLSLVMGLGCGDEQVVVQADQGQVSDARTQGARDVPASRDQLGSDTRATDAPTSDAGRNDVQRSDASPAQDRSSPDASQTDGVAFDVGHTDVRRPDAHRPDTRRPDTSQTDGVAFDVGHTDVRRPDTRRPDTNQPDTNQPDTSLPDTSLPDTSLPDTRLVADASPPPCRTRITYGSSWLHGPDHPAQYDDAEGLITWDGSCSVDSGGNAVATLSNGWMPYFAGRSCVIALDYSGGCAGVPTSCQTRVTYGPSWYPGPDHPARFDDVNGVATWDGLCHQSGGDSWAQLSTGWTPYFAGEDGCDLAFRYQSCGGLYANPVVDTDCPDPGVLKEGDTYYMVCTPGYNYPIRTSTDLVHWTYQGPVFSSQPAWATGGFWAPELHKVGDSYIVYYSATSSASGTFALGAGVASQPLGPYQDLGQPLLSAPAPGVIDAHYFHAASGKHYLLWKVDGNAVGQPTPILIQELAPDGLSVIGSATEILRNTLSWEGALIEGPWMIEHGSFFYLFYSGNGFADPSYSVGVARATSPLGPFTKLEAPILYSKGAWVGPGHGSVVRGPAGDWVHVYHSWVVDQILQPPGRIVLVDRLQWQDGWPLMRGAPSSRSQPLP